MTRPTIRDVAQKAGVGIGTVSRVLNHAHLVSPETRKLVMDAITEMGFRPNTIARQLPRKTRVHNIGVITHKFLYYRAFAERLRGMQSALQEIDNTYELVLYSVSSLEHYDERLKTIIQTSAVEGLVIIDLDLTEQQIQLLESAGMPLVGINHFQNREWTCIGTNNFEGGYMATNHLLDLGHTRIAYVGDEFEDVYFKFNSSYERFVGFQRAMLERKLPVRQEYVRLGLHNFEVAKALATDLLKLPNPPTAIFAMSDFQALGCIRAARDMGLRVPEDLSVIGYDDVEMSYHTDLTTVRQHLELSGTVSIHYLLGWVKGEKPTHSPTLPALELVIRQTTNTYTS
ncbi:MAG: LacI family DNA-binding transcriptional regulator [Anaerolineae bacterium]|nr:LacI family DNA-binding transcriptional regulator [Anaerolineae bacterium]